jgi:hypothetical protein
MEFIGQETMGQIERDSTAFFPWHMRNFCTLPMIREFQRGPLPPRPLRSTPSCDWISEVNSRREANGSTGLQQLCAPPSCYQMVPFEPPSEDGHPWTATECAHQLSVEQTIQGITTEIQWELTHRHRQLHGLNQARPRSWALCFTLRGPDFWLFRRRHSDLVGTVRAGFAAFEGPQSALAVVGRFVAFI